MTVCHVVFRIPSEMNKGIINALSGADIVLLESNHDPEMLMNNPHYSMTLKRRILGRFGHLSNDSCAQSVLRLMDTGVGHVVLGHLSAENNTPELAMNTALDTIFRAGLRADEDITVDMAWRDHVGKIYHVETKR